MRFHFGWKSHVGVKSALYLRSHEWRRNETQNGMDFISVILSKMKFQTGMRFSYEQNLLETKWISADLLDIACNTHVCLKLIADMDFKSVIWQKWNFISGNEISCKHYPKWNIGLFWNVTKMKFRVNTPGWNFKPVWVYFTFHVNVLLMLPKVTT